MCARAGADHRGRRLTALEEDRRRDRKHVVARRRQGVLVDVQLCELDLPFRLGLQLLQDRLDGAELADVGFGEDYELLAAVADSGRFTAIGRCEAGEGVLLTLNGEPYELGGWEHFR